MIHSKTLLFKTTLFVLLIGFSLISSQAEQLNDEAILKELAADITGDGTSDELRVVMKGENRIEAVDGASSKVLWSSPCYMNSLGKKNQLGSSIAPILYDCNGDGLKDLIFASRGCKAIVSMDRKTGAVLWKLPFFNNVQWMERDILLEGDRLLVAVRREGSQLINGVGIVALNARDASLQWASRIDPLSSSCCKDNFDVMRSKEGSEAILVFNPAGSSASQGGASMPVGSSGISVGISWSLPLALDGISDTARFLMNQDRIIYAGLKEINAVKRADGSPAWNWKVPGGKKLVSAAALEHEGSIFLLAWIERPARSFPAEVLIACFNAADGTVLWHNSIPDLPAGTMTEIISCSMTVRVGKEITLDHKRPKKKESPRRIILDRNTGKILSDTRG